MEARIKSYIKKKEKSKNKERNSFKILKVTQNLKPKKDKEKEDYDVIEKDKKEEKREENIEENYKTKRNLKNNRSIAILSDSETLKTEATRGDTFIENNKNKYVYKKSVNRKNCSFAIKNFISGKNTIAPTEKKNRLNNSMSLNKILRDSDSSNITSKDSILNTNHNFYKKQSNLLENYRINHLERYNKNNQNIFYNKSNLIEKYNNNISIFYGNQEFINIEDLLIIEEKFNDVLISVKSRHNTPNECFELLNSYQQSSVYLL